MIKVAIIVPSLDTGGAENMASLLAAHINKDMFYIELLVLSSKKGSIFEKNLEYANVKTIYFNKNLGFSLNTLFKIYKYLNHFKPNVIHTHLSGCVYAIPWALLHNVKILHTIHSRPIYEVRGIARRVLKFLYKRKCAVPIAISDTIAKETVDLYNIKLNLVKTIFNPVDVARFSCKFRKKTHLDEVVFVNVARFSHIKNQIGLVEAFSRVCKELPSTRLVLIGDGGLKIKVEERVKQLSLGDKVEFTGNVSDIPERLAEADIFVLPSHYEGLPMSILEAMATGLPVIATAVGGVPDIVRENGILVSVGDTDGLANAMITLSKNEELRKRMGKIARNEVNKYDISEISVQYEQLYKKYTKKTESKV